MEPNNCSYAQTKFATILIHTLRWDLISVQRDCFSLGSFTVFTPGLTAQHNSNGKLPSPVCPWKELQDYQEAPAFPRNSHFGIWIIHHNPQKFCHLQACSKTKKYFLLKQEFSTQRWCFGIKVFVWWSLLLEECHLKPKHFSFTIRENKDLYARSASNKKEKKRI